MKEQSKRFCLCPFDPNHIIAPEKIKAHIEKCKSPNRKEFAQCQYDPSHWFLIPEIMKHEKKCQKASKQGRSQQAPNISLSSIIKQEDLSSDEDIKEINMNLSGQKFRQKEEFSRDLKKMEQKEKGSNGLWKQPNFGEWFQRVKGEFAEVRKIPKRQMELDFNFQDSF